MEKSKGMIIPILVTRLRLERSGMYCTINFSGKIKGHLFKIFPPHAFAYTISSGKINTRKKKPEEPGSIMPNT